MRFVLLNGPPRAGKDTAASTILARRSKGLRLGMSYHLKRATHAAYGMPDRDYDAFEAVKDESRPEFLGLTPRQAYIEHSERYMKPLHGEEVFGKLYVRAARAAGAPLIVAPDAGFSREWTPALEEFGSRNFLLLRIYRSGCDFSRDSRSYITLPGVKTVDIANPTGDPKLFATRVMEAVRAWS